MRFWRKIFGGEEWPKADNPQKRSTLKSPVSSPQPTPATPPRPARPQAHSIATRDEAASFREAVAKGDLEKVKTLLKDYPILVMDKDDKYGETPLHVAAGSGRKDMVELLLANNAEVNVKAKFGDTP